MKHQYSVALVALSLFVLVNIVLAWSVAGSPLNHFIHVKDQIKEQGVLFQACNSAIAEYRSKPPADVVLMGSSVLVAPVWSVDAGQVASTPDLYHHHRSFALEDTLARCLGRSVKVVCMAIPGAMVSDLFLLVDKVLQDQQSPQDPYHPMILVIVLSPRDFMDDLLTGETKTAVFESLVSPRDLPELGDLYFSSGAEKIDFILNNAFFLYGKRWRYQQKCVSGITDLLSRLQRSELTGAVLIGSGVKEKSTSDVVKSNPMSGGAHVNAPATGDHFLQEHDRPQLWKRSVEEYRARYKHFNGAQFAKQVRFLDYLLSAAALRKIKVILVNMPLTQDNLALMPKGLYGSYLRSVEALANRHKVTFVDFQRDSYYVPDTFYDTVHLNRIGGAHFMQKLAGVIESSRGLVGLPCRAM